MSINDTNVRNLIEAGTRLAESEKWRDLCEGIKDPVMKSFTAIMLQNQSNYMKSLNEATFSSNIGAWDKYAFPIIRAVMPNFTIQDLISIQPMKAQTSLVFMLKYFYSTNKGNIASGTEAFPSFASSYPRELVPSEDVGIGNGIAQQFIFTLGMKPIRPTKFQLIATIGAVPVSITDDGNGNLVGAVGTINYTTGAVDVTFAQPVDNNTHLFATYEYISEGNASIPEMDFSLISSPVSAEVMKLRGRWSMESIFSFRDLHGEDAESEITNVLANALKASTEQLIAEDLWNLSDTYSIPAPANQFSIVPGSGISQQEHVNGFVNYLNRESMAMFYQTKKAMPNWILCGTEVASIIGSITGFESADPAGQAGILKLGRLRNRFDVYVNPQMTSTDYILGWKGASWLEAGYAYLPYITMYSTPSIMLDDFVGRKGFASQGARKMIEKSYYKRGRIKLTA